MNAPRRQTTRARDAGFTLVELVVVVAVLGILFAIAGIPALSSAEGELAQAELYVRDALRTAREQAFSTRTPHGVAFDAVGERLIVLAADGTPVPDPLTKAPYVLDFDAPNMPVGVTIASADFGAAGSAALFDAQGDPLTGGSVVLVADGLTLTLSLDAVTGLVSTN